MSTIWISIKEKNVWLWVDMGNKRDHKNEVLEFFLSGMRMHITCGLDEMKKKRKGGEKKLPPQIDSIRRRTSKWASKRTMECAYRKRITSTLWGKFNNLPNNTSCLRCCSSYIVYNAISKVMLCYCTAFLRKKKKRSKEDRGKEQVVEKVSSKIM